MNKTQILSKGSIRIKNYDYRNRDCGYFAVDEYYVALRDVGFIT